MQANRVRVRVRRSIHRCEGAYRFFVGKVNAAFLGFSATDESGTGEDDDAQGLDSSNAKGSACYTKLFLNLMRPSVASARKVAPMIASKKVRISFLQDDRETDTYHRTGSQQYQQVESSSRDSQPTGEF